MKYLILLVLLLFASSANALICPVRWNHDFKDINGAPLNPDNLSFKLYYNGKPFYTIKNGRQVKLGYTVWGMNAKCYPCSTVTMKAFYKTARGVLESDMSKSACPINQPVMCK